MEVMLIDIIIMERNKNNENFQCFTDRSSVQLPLKQKQQFQVDLNKKISEHMPANELRTVRRPQNMISRTFFLDTSYCLLKQSINHSCIQNISQTQPGKLKLKIVNSQNLSLEQYFSKSKFKCIYNKLEAYRSDNKTFLGRLKGIDTLIDYNWKNFKQFQPYSNKNKPKSDQVDSNFESGNICRAYSNYEEQNEYYLLIENDVNTYGYNNWFFFRGNFIKKGVRRFTIVNFIKKTSFFSQGMLISIFSKRKWEKQGEGWFKGGDKITFSSINFIRNHHQNQYYSCLSFQYDVEEDDQIYFALNQPYTYSRLTKFLHKTKQHYKKKQKYQNANSLEIKNIGYTIANNIIPSVRINKNTKSTEVVLVLARQHPCETTGSFIAEYLIKNLINETNQINQYLLQQFEFVIIPMVNPDGVIHGMSRCNMSGLDLNRHWGEDMIKEFTPETAKIKQLINNISKTKKIKYMIDLHGHGKKLNSFFFSCKGSERQNYRLFSLSMKKFESRFNLCECTYGISRDKENTIRSKINSMGISHSYTLQTSLYGWKNQQNEIRPFNEDDYDQISKSLIKSIFLIEAPKSLTMAHLGTTKELLISEMGSMIDAAEKDDKAILYDNQILSDSDPQGDRLDVKDLLGKCQNNILKKKIQDLEKKKLKKKQVKTWSKFSSGKLSSKNMRQTCPPSFQASSKFTSFNQYFFGKQVPQKIEVKTSKKSSMNEKWEERRNKILSKQRNESANNISQQVHVTKINMKNYRVKSQIGQFVDKKMTPVAAINHSKAIYAKKKMISHKMKTEFKQIQEYNLVTEQEIKQKDNRKSALQIRFRQLKNESSNLILTETLSILKIAPEKEKNIPKRPSRSINTASLKKREFLPTEPNSQYLKTEAKEQKEFQQTLRYKKFKQFLSNNTNSNKKQIQKSPNSVFYYFPIL